jgi:predicted phosphodiesterase
MVHDAGGAAGRHARLHARFPMAQVVVYGHSHQPELTRADTGQLVLNPGSPTQRRRAPTHTVAWLELADGAVRDASLVHLD